MRHESAATPGQTRGLDYEAVAVELVRALRGRRSCAELSRRAGYRSNIVHRWEAQQCWPTAARFLAVQRRLRPKAPSWIQRFFHTEPAWAVGLDPVSPRAVATFLQQLKGKTPVVRVAELAGRNRYSVARWLEGTAEPKLPEFLLLVDVISRRLLDLIAALEDPLRLPSLRTRWQALELARKAAYEFPWSHAVLRALELDACPRSSAEQEAFLACRLGTSLESVREALRVLVATEQVRKGRRGYTIKQIATLDTGHDPERAHLLREAWTRTALERLEARAPGHFGYSVFAISRADLIRLHTLHLQYVRAMQEIIASSSPNECVGLYCAQLLDLGDTNAP